LVASAVLPGAPEGGAWSPTDPDDSWSMVEPTASTSASLEDGSVMTWRRGDAPLTAGTEAPLRFVVAPPSADAPPLEPYMGMLAHAAVVRDDGGVFVHL